MPAPLLIPLVAAGAAAAQSGINYFTQKRNTDRTIQANKQMAEYSYAKDMEMMHMMNQYNSPTAQMSRYKEAGLNPNLIYGQGTPGNMQSTPKYQAPRIDYKYAPPVDIPNTIGMYQDVAMKDAQIDNIQAQTENVEARTAVELINKRYRGAQTEQLVQYGLDLSEAELALKRQNLTNAQKAEITADLRNQFQQYANQWAKYGITGRDALMIRSGIKIMQQLGIDHQFLLDMLPQGTSLEDVLKMQ